MNRFKGGDMAELATVMAADAATPARVHALVAVSSAVSQGVR
jgi:hypothetical protein